ncbi:MAG: S-layer family protein [Chlorogloeopsis fritschii C42_A2020_084]|uniref:S-layer family protein n=1 Tax=Chlorogloeopsis fritschii TaxID=1124 RepID=UPI0019F7796B|nr:S-layer family protein [Chlorogloeopsis fritschii]MBF2006228.1 S-layer family protein [Chlorogloeopsis fritschii C42_A2020_084]
MAKVWQYKDWQMVLASTLAVSATLIIPATDAFAQNITLDGSLGTAGTLTGSNYVIPQSVGQTAGNNLFHSFGKFNLDTNEAAIFQSADNIRNILSRVTGGTPSSIDGLIRTENSNVNFFLINPSGIIFGRNARLDVSGSFVASTANAIQFGDRGFFSATSVETPSPLLTVNPSAFFFNQLQPGRIENNSTAPIGNNFSGLRVPDGRSLLLVGGDITINGGSLYAPGGRVELAGIAGNGAVGLNFNGNHLSLNVPNNLLQNDILLTDNARVIVAGQGAGSITLNAKNIEIKERSILFAGIRRGIKTPIAPAGDIEINAANQVSLNRSFIYNDLQEEAIGQGGNIKITTDKLSIKNGTEVAASTFGQGSAGSVIINVKDNVSIDGSSSVFSTVESEGRGNSGDIYITTDSLAVTNGGQITTSTKGKGNAGNVIINARNTVSFDGEDRDGFRSAAFSQVLENAFGTGGSIKIITGSLSVTNGALLATDTHGNGNAGSVIIDAKKTVSFDGKSRNGFSSRASSVVRNGASGKGGNVEITTGSLSVTNGAQLSTGTLGQGDAGNVIINARDTVSFDGKISDRIRSGVFSSVEENAIGKGGRIEIVTDSVSITNGAVLDSSTSGQGDAGSIIVTANSFKVTNGGRLRTITTSQSDAGSIILKVKESIYLAGDGSGLFANTTEGSTGNGGSIFIDPRTVMIQDGATIAVDSQGTGEGGNIQLISDTLTLDDATITAETRSNTGGNITLGLQDLLLLRNGSKISTSAGNRQFGGDGGNIDIDTGFIVAIPEENNDITANAFTGKGGRVDITTNGIFGIKPQERQTEESDITASSELGVSGQVTINTLQVDPSRGLVQLPSNLVDASRQIAQGCTPRGRQTASRFIATGRGGLPLSPNEPLRGRAAIASWVTLPAQATDRQTNKLSASTSVTKSTPQIVEAQGWVLDAKGETHLVAQSPQMTSSIPSSLSCS